MLTHDEREAIHAFAKHFGPYGWKSKLWTVWQDGTWGSLPHNHVATLQRMRNRTNGMRELQEFRLPKMTR